MAANLLDGDDIAAGNRSLAIKIEIAAGAGGGEQDIADRVEVDVDAGAKRADRDRPTGVERQIAFCRCDVAAGNIVGSDQIDIANSVDAANAERTALRVERDRAVALDIEGGD